MFKVHAQIELTKCDVKAKVTTIESTLITPQSTPVNGSLFIGDINNDTYTDIGFMGGFAQKESNNERFYLKYEFSYQFNDSEVVFYEH